MPTNTKQFNTACEMPYANSNSTKEKFERLSEELKEHLKSVQKDKTLFFTNGETICVPDIHGDFIHLIVTLHRHDLINKDFKLKKDHTYVFLGDFYDRSPDADAIDFWLNKQIKDNVKIYRLIGNHEMAFFERDPNGYPVIFPSQDSIKDISNDFQTTENLLKSIADGNIMAAYVENKTRAQNILYVHSYIINDDFIELGLEPNTDILDFTFALNERLKLHGQYTYDLFLEQKKTGKFDWKAIMKSFHDDNLFNIYKKKNDISTSFMWRRTSLPVLNIYPTELDVDIPDNVYQIVGHTPVFSFDLQKNQPINKPFVISAKNGTGRVQFNDVGIGYYYKPNDFERPEVVINVKLAYNI